MSADEGGSIHPVPRAIVVWSVTAACLAAVIVGATSLADEGLRGIVVSLVALTLGYSFLRAAIALTFRGVRVRRGDLAAFAASTVLTAAALELSFRAFLPQPVYAVDLAPWGFWHIPNVSFLHGADPRYEGSPLRGTEYVTRITYNARGMRDPDRAVPKPAGVRRILLLGDSFGEGMEVDDERTVGRVLERLLSESAAPPAAFREGPRARTPAPPDAPAAVVTGALLRELRDEVSADRRALLVGTIRFNVSQPWERADFFDRERIRWVDLSLADPERDRAEFFYRFDPHWNARGHERAAHLILRAIRASGPEWDDPGARYEVVNAAMSALSTCKELWVYRELGRPLEPDLVLLLHTGTDDRNLADADLCSVDPSGRVAFHAREHGPLQRALRAAAARVKLSSTFLAWAIDRVVALPFVRPLARRTGEASAGP